MIAWFAKNSVAANLLLMVIIFCGLFTLVNRLTIEIFPTFEVDTINISTVYEGTTPEEIEESITLKVEEEIADVQGIEQIVSRSSENASLVTLEVEDGFDVDKVMDDVRTAVDSINDLPSEAERPVVSNIRPTRGVISIAVFGDVSEHELTDYANRLHDDLLTYAGITQVDIGAIRDYEMIIEVSQQQLQKFNLSLQDVADAINQSSLNLSAGNIKSKSGDVLVRLQGQAYNKSEFENVFITGSNSGQSIYLKDIASITDGFEEQDMKARFNGQPAVWVQVNRVGKESAIDIARKVRQHVEKIQSDLPQSVRIETWNDDSRIIKSRLTTLTNSAIQGGILVVILLTLFLRPAVSLWVSLGIPISFLGGIAVLPIIGVTINLISVFAFIMVLGIVVDDAIVTGENVYRHLREGKNGIDAAIEGTREVSVPVTFGVLTTIAAFVPMLILDGDRGKIFAQIPAVVIPVLLFSLVESKFILPAHLKHVKPRKLEEVSGIMRWQMKFSHGFERVILKYYQPALMFSLKNKFFTYASLFSVAILVFSMTKFGWIKYTFFPSIESESIRVNLTMPTSTPFTTTDSYVQHMLKQALEIKQKYTNELTGDSLVKNIAAETGSSGSSSGNNIGRLRMELQSPEDRAITISVTDIVREWREMIGEIPGAESLSFRAEIGRAGNPIDVQLTGNDFATMEEIAEDVKVFLDKYQGVFDIQDSSSDGKVEMNVVLKPGAENLGINKTSIARQLRQTFFGIVVQSFQRGQDDIDVRVRFPLEERQSLQNIENLYVDTQSGQKVLFNEIAELKPTVSPVTIYRIDRKRTMNIIADIDKETVRAEELKSDLIAFIEQRLEGVQGIAFSLEGEAKEQQETFTSLIWSTSLLLFGIYVLLAIPLKSYSQPFIVMSIIPFGVVGAILGHILVGFNLSLMSFLGAVALLGVVVNDSLVLVDFINQQRAKGKDVFEAVTQAGAMRFRPVVLTSLTTFVGLAPLLLEKSTQAQFLKPMAISLGFGILFATVITLFIVPINYLLAYESKNNVKSGLSKVFLKQSPN